MISCHPGDLVDIWEGGGILAAVVLGEEKGRLRVVTEADDELRIAASRVALVAGRGAPLEPRRAALAAKRHAEEAGRRAGTIDVASLWDLLVDEGGRRSTEELAGLAFSDRTPADASALFRRLAAAKTWFERHGEAWEARGRDAVEETLKRERAVAEKARRRAAFLDRARAPLGRSDPDDAPFLKLLIDLAVLGDESPDRADALALVADLLTPSPPPSPIAAFDLLVRLGVFEEDENLDIHRFGLRTAFPEEVASAARAAAASPDLDGRRDLTGLELFTVDDEETVEIDDALSWEERDGGGGVAGVHIASPSAFVRPSDPVDVEALKRAATYYFPDRRLPMIPAAISEEAASLRPGETRPALSFLVALDAAASVVSFEIVPSIVRSRARLTYDEADAALEGGASAGPGVRAALGALRRAAADLERERAAAGAVIVRAPEVSVKVGPGGRVELRRIDARGPSRLLVAEMMILANRLAASFCRDRGIPAIYRRQAAPEKPPPPLPEGAYDPVAVRALRRSLRRGEIGLAPDRHYALGLPAYLQATSPLRRYQDLAVHRQIEASLSGRALPYDAEAMARIAATTEEAERAARRAEAGADAYWILRHLAGRVGGTLEAIVVAVEPRRTEVEIVETLRAATIAPRGDHVPGRRLTLAIEEARPREGILRLREASASS